MANLILIFRLYKVNGNLAFLKHQK